MQNRYDQYALPKNRSPSAVTRLFTALECSSKLLLIYADKFFIFWSIELCLDKGILRRRLRIYLGSKSLTQINNTY